MTKRKIKPAAIQKESAPQKLPWADDAPSAPERKPAPFAEYGARIVAVGEALMDPDTRIDELAVLCHHAGLRLAIAFTHDKQDIKELD